MVIVAIIVALLGQTGLFLHFHNRERSRWFIERQQLQSKLDMLIEKELQRNGVPVDFTRPARRQFTEAVKRASFAKGWASDKIATPSPEAK